MDVLLEDSFFIGGEEGKRSEEKRVVRVATCLFISLVCIYLFLSVCLHCFILITKLQKKKQARIRGMPVEPISRGSKEGTNSDSSFMFVLFATLFVCMCVCDAEENYSSFSGDEDNSQQKGDTFFPVHCR